MTTVEENTKAYDTRSEENKAIIRRFIKSYNDRNLDIFEELVSPDYVDHTHGTKGREAFKALFTMAFEGFPDWFEDVQEIIAEGDRVWVRVIATGTHTGDWNLMGTPLPATGRKVRMEMVFIWKIVDGKLIEGRGVDESVDFLRQLGLVKYTEKGKKVFAEINK